MARKVNEENERIKRAYFTYLREAKRADMTTVDKAADAILRFEKSTGYKSFKRFSRDQVATFKSKLNRDKSAATGKKLSKATVSSILRANKGLITWLAGEPGYKSRIKYSDADYFNQNAKDARVAHAQRPKKCPTLAQCRHAFDQMPETTQIEKRNKAIFAFLMITAARDGAIASLRLHRIDLVEGCVYQDARDVNTKGSKTFTTYFMPVDPIYRAYFESWVRYLREDLLFGHDDALFPPPDMGRKDGVFAVMGLSHRTYANAGPMREAIKAAFTSAGLQAFAPHSFRNTIVAWGEKTYLSREAFKAFSQNIGHSHVVTTVSAYMHVTEERRAELIREIV